MAVGDMGCNFDAGKGWEHVGERKSDKMFIRRLVCELQYDKLLLI